MSYNLNDEANYEREVEALVKILNAIPCYHGYIITRDYQTQIEEDGHTIEVCLSRNGFCKCRWSNEIRLL
ncbi:hypothetical protein [uncultured Prevotella sp.]|uniref:hypothetical protein n=1 Tax=uncultured Prevotella sp. TaxID=159272 RepID=UPI00258D14D1|nr:hypothetical protein [uncultured Prevotella sp.]